MRKFIVILLGLFLLSGCESGEEIVCNINGKEAKFKLKEGMITSYKLDGQAKKRSEIDEINGTYFTSAKDNDEGKLVLQRYVNSLGGTCN